MGNTAFTFTAPTRIVVEWGAANNGRLAAEAARLGKRPLVVAGKSLQAGGTLDTIIETLRAVGLTPAIHIGVPPEPDLSALQACMDAVTDADADSVIAIGGGSVLDVAKGAAALAGTGHTAQEFFDGKQLVPENVSRPILVAPTTSGTGSEVTWVGVYTDKISGKKASIRGSAMMPAIALLDAELTVSCPASVTIHSGMDAFVQAVEAYTSLGANPLTDALALEAARLASYEIVAAVAATPDDRAGRESLALGSLMAGMALNTARLGLVHGLAHPIGAATGAAHGLICAALMLPVMRFNRDAASAKYDRLAVHLLGAGATGDTLYQSLEKTLRETLSVPLQLRDIGVKPGDLQRIAEESMVSGSTKANPRPVTITDALEVLDGCR
ncbi:MAG: iron-containing alcohol dehydrogenase [Armatimonadota bacterium]